MFLVVFWRPELGFKINQVHPLNKQIKLVTLWKKKTNPATEISTASHGLHVPGHRLIAHQSQHKHASGVYLFVTTLYKQQTQTIPGIATCSSKSTACTMTIYNTCIQLTIITSSVTPSFSSIQQIRSRGIKNPPKYKGLMGTNINWIPDFVVKISTNPSLQQLYRWGSESLWGAVWALWSLADVAPRIWNWVASSHLVLHVTDWVVGCRSWGECGVRWGSNAAPVWLLHLS